jgi:hypothetical protein
MKNPPSPAEAVKKLALWCFTSFRPRIKYGVNSSRNPDVHIGLQILWTPVFTYLREAASAKAGRGDEYSAIFSHLPFSREGILP